MLSHSGMTISSNAINDLIHSLSSDARIKLETLMQTHVASLVYDNFDIKFEVHTPSDRNPETTLVHLTSGTALTTIDVEANDLDVSMELWDKNPINPATEPDEPFDGPLNPNAPTYTLDDLLALSSPTLDEDGLTVSQQFQAWKFRFDLVHHGDEYFQQFKDVLGEPGTLNQIPLKKTVQVPAKAMDINQSTAVGNVDAIESLLGQAAVGDPNEHPGVKDIKNHVLLVHGDLGTGERVENFQESRSIEKTSWRRFQFVVFVMGLFHLQMACIDAIWRILLKPTKSHDDPDCLLERVGILHPKQTVKISKNPKFRQLHNIVLQDGIASRLDVWRVVVSKQDPAHNSLKAFASSKPSWSTIVAMSKQMPKDYVANGNFSARRRKPSEERDKVHENALLKNQYYLLYEELIYGMNNGDIGRVENCFIPWIFIFKATGKNKYAAHMTRFLLDLNYLFPESLR